MKVKLELDNKKYEGEVEEIVETEEALLLQVDGEKEVFVILDNVKHWIQNMETAEALNYDVSKRKQVPLVELNWYKTGDTFNMIGEPERARDIYYPEESPVSAWGGANKGIFTLASGIPSVGELNYMGVDLVIPYKTFEKQLVDFSKAGGKICFMKTVRNESQFNVAGYLVEDEPENRPGSRPLPYLWDVYNKLRDNTGKPIGCVFMAITMNPNDPNFTKYREFMLAMDYFILTYYPWDNRMSDLSDSAILERLEEIYGWIRNCGKPVMIAGQATYGKNSEGEDHHLTAEPNIKLQSDYGRGEGYPMAWYVWSGQGSGIQAKFKDDIRNDG